MEKIIEPDAAYSYAELAAIAGAGAIIVAIIILCCVAVLAARRRYDALDDPENWNWW